MKKSHLNKNHQYIKSAQQSLCEHPLFKQLDPVISLYYADELPKACWAQLYEDRYSYRLWLNLKKKLSKQEWMYILALAYSHIALEHLRKQDIGNSPISYINAAHSFVQQLAIGQCPIDMSINQGIGDSLPSWFVDPNYDKYDLDNDDDEYYDHYYDKYDLQEACERGLSATVQWALTGLSQQNQAKPISQNLRSANAWIMHSFPLLSLFASNFSLIEDDKLCKQYQIDIAAINPELKCVYVHPHWQFSTQEMIFILLHQYLHIGLRHDLRSQGRDAFYWHVAADYVINGWLVEMKVGKMPNVGIFYAPDLQDKTIESVYDQIMHNKQWQKRIKRISPFRQKGKTDMINRKAFSWWLEGDGRELDEFYRNSIDTGLDYVQQKQSTSDQELVIPASLCQEINAIIQPPLPWDTQLIKWLSPFFPHVEKQRTYTRLSRRQSATPNIPRPRWVNQPYASWERSMAIIIDTSQAIHPLELKKVLGIIRSYTISCNIQTVRLIYCDSQVHDQGYVNVDNLLHHIHIKGKGGLALQAAIDQLQACPIMPKHNPLLIISNGRIHKLHIERQHAYLLLGSGRLNYKTDAPLFCVNTQ